VRIRIRYGHWIPRALGVEGIVLYPFVLFRRGRERTSLVTLQHEMIHVRQVRARGLFGFYARYAWEYAKGRARGRGHDEAYRRISFEAEAYRDQARIALSEAETREIG
jgi:hypothetical protein